LIVERSVQLSGPNSRREAFPRALLKVLTKDRWIVAVAGFVAVASCGCASVGPKEAGPVAVDIPTRWSGTGIDPAVGPTSLVEWWSRFDDPLLAHLIDDALHANNSIGSARAALRQARALRDVAAAALFPALGISASAQRSRSAGSPAGRSSVNNFQTGLDANWELDIFGVNRRALDASEAAARASEASLGDVQVSIAAEVTLDYITLRSSQVRLAIANENLASQQETLQIAMQSRRAPPSSRPPPSYRRSRSASGT